MNLTNQLVVFSLDALRFALLLPSVERVIRMVGITHCLCDGPSFPGVRKNHGGYITVSSGYSNAPVMANYKEYGFSAVIAKPYRLTDLGKTVQKVLKKG